MLAKRARDVKSNFPQLSPNMCVVCTKQTSEQFGRGELDVEKFCDGQLHTILRINIQNVMEFSDIYILITTN